jgi:NAD(P)-dependent dehydrogenase (short-subunit alcohol dehydrogenase family)
MAAITGKTVVITGANRGIVLQFARQLVAKDNTVVAAIRNPTSELEQLKQQSGDRLTMMCP